MESRFNLDVNLASKFQPSMHSKIWATTPDMCVHKWRDAIMGKELGKSLWGLLDGKIMATGSEKGEMREGR